MDVFYERAHRVLRTRSWHSYHREQENRLTGELSEWLKEHAWKVCIRQRIEGSNPSLSANIKI